MCYNTHYFDVRGYSYAHIYTNIKYLIHLRLGLHIGHNVRSHFFEAFHFMNCNL